MKESRKYKLLKALEKEWIDCQRCELCKTRINVVFGSGNPDSEVLVIGEAPGREEDETGLPFVGDAGRVLNELFDAIGWDRERDVYITNTVCCRPTSEVTDEDGKPRVENRPPSKTEREACRPRLLEVIYIVDPLLIIAVGKVPAQALLGKVATMDSMRGRIYSATLQGRHVPIKYAVLPVYHTAYLLRTFDKREEGPWGKTAKDFALACKIIDELKAAYYGINIDREAIINAKREDD